MPRNPGPTSRPTTSTRGWSAHSLRRRRTICRTALVPEERADTEREIVVLLGALPLVSPAPGFAEPRDGAGHHPRSHSPCARCDAPPARLRHAAHHGAWRPACSCWLVGSMAGSIVWTLGHQETLAALGGWLAGQAGQSGVARCPGCGLQLHRTALVRGAPKPGGASGPPRRSPPRSRCSPTWAASWRSAASWLCRRSRWPMPAS